MQLYITIVIENKKITETVIETNKTESVKKNKSSPKSLGKSASLPFTAENVLVHCVTC